MDFSAIIKQAFQITKKYKWLWIYGLLLAAGSSGSGGGGSRSFSERSSKSGNIPTQIPENIKENTYKVLGDTINSLTSWVQSIPLWYWIFLVLSFIGIILFAIMIRWIVVSWAKGGLISGIEMALSGDEPNLLNTSRKGINKIKDLVIFSLISGLISLGIIVGGAIFLGAGYIFLNSIKPLFYLFMIFGVISYIFTIIILVILLAMVSVYAERLIVLHNYSPWDAWRKGLSLSRGNFLNTMLMGLINTGLGCSIGCLFMIIIGILLAIPAAILIYPIYKNGISWSSVIPFGGLGLLIFIFIYVSYAFNAFFAVFKYSTWNLFVKEILKNKMHSQPKAHFICRFFAFWIDMMIFLFPFIIYIYLVSGLTAISDILNSALNLIIIIILYPNLMALFSVYLTSRFGGSPGKLLTGLRVINEKDKYISIKYSFIRNYLGYMVSGLFLWLGFFWVLKDKDRRSWHDMIAGTFVVIKNKNGLLRGFFVLILFIIFYGYLFSQSIINFRMNYAFYKMIIFDITEQIKENKVKNNNSGKKHIDQNGTYDSRKIDIENEWYNYQNTNIN